jgi:pilus assembly protein Flp/PilA
MGDDGQGERPMRAFPANAHNVINQMLAPWANRGATPMLDYLRNLFAARSARRDERGASAVEYGLLIAGIAALIVVIVFAFGGVVLNDLFVSTCDKVSQSTANTNCAH